MFNRIVAIAFLIVILLCGCSAAKEQKIINDNSSSSLDSIVTSEEEFEAMSKPSTQELLARAKTIKKEVKIPSTESEGVLRTAEQFVCYLDLDEEGKKEYRKLLDHLNEWYASSQENDYSYKLYHNAAVTIDKNLDKVITEAELCEEILSHNDDDSNNSKAGEKVIQSKELLQYIAELEF